MDQNHTTRPARTSALMNALDQRILVLDGAMGTMVQRYRLTEAEYRGERFKDWKSDVRGNNDLLTLTRPQVIREIHSQYMEAGADILETNTFNSTTISMADYHMESLAYELNVEGAKLAREVADRFSLETPKKPRFVAVRIFVRCWTTWGLTKPRWLPCRSTPCWRCALLRGR